LQWDNQTIEIIHTGQPNTDAGPDFIDARIKIGDTLWAGNVEIHVQASDWENHNHDRNPAFDNVILHLVNNYDKDIYTSKGRKVPAISLKFNETIWENYQELIANQSWIPCAGSVKKADPFTVQTWLQALGIERLKDKTGEMNEHLDKTLSDWEEVFFRQLAHAFGFHVNASPFDLLARNTPYKIIKKHCDSLQTIEALLFGQAGFLLNNYSGDIYYNNLKETYDFLRNKYNLKPIDVYLWKFLRLRPGNFPTIRIAQLAGLLNKNQSLLTNLLKTETLKELQALLNCKTSAYWETHYIFSKTANHKIKQLGQLSANSIIINTIIPFYFAYGELTSKAGLKIRALEFLEKIPAEKNATVKNWEELGIFITNAFESQALIQLTNRYCSKKRCIECRIGMKIIRNAN
jgi:hypothetical protein